MLEPALILEVHLFSPLLSTIFPHRTRQPGRCRSVVLQGGGLSRFAPCIQDNPRVRT